MQDCVETAPEADDDMDFFSIEVLPTRNVDRDNYLFQIDIGVLIDEVKIVPI